MPKHVREARHGGYKIFFITGRPESQRKGTVKDLRADGYGTPSRSHLFLKPSTPPAYLDCPTSGCSTTQYKSGTRKHINSEGYAILADFGCSAGQGAQRGQSSSIADDGCYATGTGGSDLIAASTALASSS